MGQDTTSLQNAILNDFFGQVDLATNLSIGANLYLSLHFFDPGENGTQQTFEIGAAPYATYARQMVARNTITGWVIDFVTDSKAQNQGQIAFPQRTAAGTDPVATYWGLGTASSGAGTLLKRGPLIASNAAWLYAVSHDTVTPDLILVSSKHTATNQVFTDGDEYAIQPLYKDTLPAPLVTTTRYFIANTTLATGAGVATSPLTTQNNAQWKFATVSGAGAVVTMTQDGAFNIIKAAPITITNGSFPVFNALALSIFQS